MLYLKLIILGVICWLSASTSGDAALQLVADCQRFALDSDCKFYECIEKVVPCGKTGYILSYGHRYCYRFQSVLFKFTQDGKDWITNVRKCQIMNLFNFYQSNGGNTNCPAIKEYGFDMHVGCYVDMEPGVCEVIKNGYNHLALLSGYQLTEFFSYDQRYALTQITETLLECAKKSTTSIASSATEYVEKMKKILSDWWTSYSPK